MEKIEVIATHKVTFKHYKEIMTIPEWLMMVKNSNFYYLAYQLGYSQYKLSN